MHKKVGFMRLQLDHKINFLHFAFFIPFPLNSFLISALLKVAVMVLILSGFSRLLDGKILQQHPVAIACCGIWWKGIFRACVLRIPWSLWMSKMVTVPRMCQVCSYETFYSAAPMLYCPFSKYPEKNLPFYWQNDQVYCFKAVAKGLIELWAWQGLTMPKINDKRL